PSGAPLHPAQAGSAALRPHSPSMDTKGKGEQGPTLDELKTQLRELRATVELMKSQQEMKQLVSELDEEKRIRLSLQVTVKHFIITGIFILICI
uniref:Uncharacterized protein n=1 Tax=Astyanax mexicanus TaxID=7994 RepID=A0A8B9KZ71_ASTMX